MEYITYKDFEDVSRILNFLPHQSENYWKELSFENAKNIFNLMYKNLSAYRKFLKSKGCGLQTIKNLDDFQQLPIITKKDYLKAYKFEDLIIGKPEEVKSFFMSSGSTGEPTIWPRLPEADISYSIMVNFFYTIFWQINRKKTLYISAMDLGIWASGNLQFNAAKYCATHHNFTFANPGADYRYIYSIIKKLHSYYDIIIIATYPSVARKLIDYLQSKDDLDLKSLNIKFMLGGEAHTIEWRYFLLNKLGYKKDSLNVVLDYYGTSDSGGPGSGTPLTTLIQNLCYINKKLCQDLFGQKVVPSLFQKNPFLHIESANGEILVTYPGQLPLCRYNSGDTGGILEFSKAINILRKHGIDIEEELKKYGFENKHIWKWPFVYLTGRSDYAVSIGGAVVYPTDIEGVFFKEDTDLINSFKIGIKYEKAMQQKLIIYIELKENIILDNKTQKKLTKKYEKLTLESLLNSNEDYYGSYFIDQKALRPYIKICQYYTNVFKNEENRLKSNFIVR